MVVVVVVGWVVVVVVGVGVAALGDGAGAAGAVGALALPPCVASAIWSRPCCRRDCAVGVPPWPLSVSRMVGMSLSSGSKKPDDGLPHWLRVAMTEAERPLEWLATMRRQMPASRSRSRPAM